MIAARRRDHGPWISAVIQMDSQKRGHFYFGESGYLHLGTTVSVDRIKKCTGYRKGSSRCRGYAKKDQPWRLHKCSLVSSVSDARIIYDTACARNASAPFISMS